MSPARALEGPEQVAALDLAELSDARLDAHVSLLRRPLALLEAARARALSEMEQRVRQTAAPDRVTGQLLENRGGVPLGRTHADPGAVARRGAGATPCTTAS